MGCRCLRRMRRRRPTTCRRGGPLREDRRDARESASRSRRHSCRVDLARQGPPVRRRAGGAGGAQNAAASQGGAMGQMGQLMGMPMQMAQQAAQLPMQAMGMAAALPQAVMQGVQQAVQQVGQLGGAGEPSKGESADEALRAEPPRRSRNGKRSRARRRGSRVMNERRRQAVPVSRLQRRHLPRRRGYLHQHGRPNRMRGSTCERRCPEGQSGCIA